MWLRLRTVSHHCSDRAYVSIKSEILHLAKQFLKLTSSDSYLIFMAKERPLTQMFTLVLQEEEYNTFLFSLFLKVWKKQRARVKRTFPDFCLPLTYQYRWKGILYPVMKTLRLCGCSGNQWQGRCPSHFISKSKSPVLCQGTPHLPHSADTNKLSNQKIAQTGYVWVPACFHLVYSQVTLQAAEWPYSHDVCNSSHVHIPTTALLQFSSSLSW